MEWEFLVFLIYGAISVLLGISMGKTINDDFYHLLDSYREYTKLLEGRLEELKK